MSSNFSKDVVITDGARQYFRPSIYKMEREVKYEVPDYKSVLHDESKYEDLTLVNQTYDRLCYVRKRLTDLKCDKKNPNMVDVMVLLGVEHKIQEQMVDVNGFIMHYENTISNIEKQLSSWKYKIRRLFACGKSLSNTIPLFSNLQHQTSKLRNFERELKDLNALFHYVQGKVLYLTDPNISQLGIIKD